jgi:mannitol-specific phosphotransferase system IIBC component
MPWTPRTPRLTPSAEVKAIEAYVAFVRAGYSAATLAALLAFGLLLRIPTHARALSFTEMLSKRDLIEPINPVAFAVLLVAFVVGIVLNKKGAATVEHATAEAATKLQCLTRARIAAKGRMAAKAASEAVKRVQRIARGRMGRAVAKRVAEDPVRREEERRRRVP